MSHSHSHGHGHSHRHGSGPVHSHAAESAAPVRLRPPSAGHNGPRPALQWQTLHDSPIAQPEPHAPDLDLVEASFVEGFTGASDVTSFLRLAGIPFVARGTDGRDLRLLRVEIEDLTDVAALTPLMGGAGHRYDPLPTRFTSRRRRLSFAYFDGTGIASLSFADARRLEDITPP